MLGRIAHLIIFTVLNQQWMDLSLLEISCGSMTLSLKISWLLILILSIGLNNTSNNFEYKWADK
jgi:hypothetical protein